MKKIICIISLVFCMSFFVHADSIRQVSVLLGGTPVDCASYGQPATIVEGRTMVPLRAIFEALGADVIWDGNTRTIHAARNEICIKLTIGQKTIEKNGQEIEIDVPAMIMNDRTLVPARAVAEAFDVGVEWDKVTRTVLLTATDSAPEPQINKNSIDRRLFGKHLYSTFNFGMTKQQCWNSIHPDDFEKQLKAENGKQASITVYSKVGGSALCDSKISAQAAAQSIALIFSDDYLYSAHIAFSAEEAPKAFEGLCSYLGQGFTVNNSDEATKEYIWTKDGVRIAYTLSQKENEQAASGTLTITDSLIHIYLNGYDVEQAATEKAMLFLDALSQFDLKTASGLTTAPNSVKRVGIYSAEDAVSFTGFDKNALTEKLFMQSFDSDEGMKPIAEAISDSIEKVLTKALSRCSYSVEKTRGESDSELIVSYCLNIPDVSYILEEAYEKIKGSTLFSTESTAQESKQFIEELAKKLSTAIIDASDTLFDTAPRLTLRPKNPLTVKKIDGEWIVAANGEYITEVFEIFNIFS